MKKILFALLTCVAFNSYAGDFSLAVGAGQEDIDTKTKLGHVTADLFQVLGSYRMDSGIILGASAMVGYPNKTWASDEGRYELFTGYSMKINRLSPYATVAYGKRTREDKDTINYYAVTVGSKIKLTDKWFGDLSYRFRDTRDMKWNTDTYFAGLGYNLSNTTAVQAVYGKTLGDYDSNQYSLVLINRF